MSRIPGMQTANPAKIGNAPNTTFLQHLVIIKRTKILFNYRGHVTVAQCDMRPMVIDKAGLYLYVGIHNFLQALDQPTGLVTINAVNNAWIHQPEQIGERRIIYQ